MIPSIIDNPEYNGIDIVMDFENGLALTIFMEDAAAQDMVNIIQNKLNARL